MHYLRRMIWAFFVLNIKYVCVELYISVMKNKLLLLIAVFLNLYNKAT